MGFDESFVAVVIDKSTSQRPNVRVGGHAGADIDFLTPSSTAADEPTNNGNEDQSVDE